MATSFTSLPIIDLGQLGDADFTAAPTPEILSLASQLHEVFATSGFAYLTCLPLSFTHADVFALSKQIFGLPVEEKMRMAKKTFVRENENTYRGYFPIQPLKALDNLKEGFEMGSGRTRSKSTPSKNHSPFNMYEPNVWPPPNSGFSAQARRDLTKLYVELQALSAKLLSLLALSLGKEADYFASWLDDSLSTLRLLHYPAVNTPAIDGDDASFSSTSTIGDVSMTDSDKSSMNDSVFSAQEADIPINQHKQEEVVKLSCTPHTDSGILTLLHQDPTGGLEVLNSSGQWISAPYVPGSVVVNIGDLMAKVSEGRFVATMHRVRAPKAVKGRNNDGFGRFSIPFFFEPGEECVVRTIEEGDGEGVRYGDHVRGKMATWVEFQGDEEGDE